jgi:hypothetical protein
MLPANGAGLIEAVERPPGAAKQGVTRASIVVPGASLRPRPRAYAAPQMCLQRLRGEDFPSMSGIPQCGVLALYLLGKEVADGGRVRLW